MTLLAGDKIKYRPQEIPANLHTGGGAGDAGGILPNIGTEDRPPGRRSADFDHGPP